MKAVVFEGRERLRIAERPVPRCGPDDVLLRVAACGICGGDARSYFTGDRFSHDRVPGHEAAGVVAEAGANAAWRPGHRLALAAEVHCHACPYCRREWFQLCENLQILGKHMDGGMTDYMLLTPEILARGVVNRIPDGLSLLDAALSEPLCSVLASHDELAVQPGEAVAVLGCGPMGILHLEMLAARGACVAMVDISKPRLERARADFGADCVIDASAEDVPAAVRAWTGGLGADVVITATPSPEAVAQSVSLVRKRGRIGVFGGLPADRACVALDMNRIHYGEIRVVGNFSYHPATHCKALEWLAAGRIRAAKLITRYPLEEAARAFSDIREGKVLKAVIVPNRGELL